MHATEFLKAPDQQPLGAMVVLAGAERSLKLDALAALTRLVCGDGDGDGASVTKFPGKETDWKSVRDELLTVSMFGDRRLVIVENADSAGRSRSPDKKKSADDDEADGGDDAPAEKNFVSVNRDALERYFEKPVKSALLVLDVSSFPKTTRLYKLADKLGLVVECTELSGADLTRWIQSTARDRFTKQITRDAAMLLPEMVGPHLGLLDQEIEKLATYVGDRPQIDSDDVKTIVGGWKAETTWTMLNALRDGQLKYALACLDKLLVAGEHPNKLLGGIVFVFRKFAIASALARHKLPVNAALKQAGIFPRDIGPAEAYLRRLGFARADHIARWLLEIDLQLKGGSRTSERILLEQLFVQLSGKLSAEAATGNIVR